LTGCSTADAEPVSTTSGPVSTAEQLAAQMYSEHHADVFRYVRARVSSLAEAEDLTSDVFCKAVAGLGSYRPMRASALPWLYTIAAHRVIDHYRSSRPVSDLDAAAHVADGGPNPADVVATRLMVREVWELSKKLPPSQRRALWLRYGEELELREIAALMGRSVEAVKLLVHRAVRGVRKGLPAGAQVGNLPIGSGELAIVRPAPTRRPTRDAPALAA